MNGQTRSVEWLLAGLMLAWGVGLMMPGNSLELTHLRYLKTVAPEAIWAFGSVMIGGVRLAALYINGSWCRTPLIRAACSGLGIIWWIILGALTQAGYGDGPQPPMTMFYPVFVAFEGYSVYRGARDSYHSGALRKWRQTPSLR